MRLIAIHLSVEGARGAVCPLLLEPVPEAYDFDLCVSKRLQCPGKPVRGPQHPQEQGLVGERSMEWCPVNLVWKTNATQGCHWPVRFCARICTPWSTRTLFTWQMACASSKRRLRVSCAARAPQPCCFWFAPRSFRTIGPGHAWQLLLVFAVLQPLEC